jgi:hypothetical protein
VTNVNNPFINLYQTIIKTNESKIIETKTDIIFELKTHFFRVKKMKKKKKKGVDDATDK